MKSIPVCIISKDQKMGLDLESGFFLNVNLTPFLGCINFRCIVYTVLLCKRNQKEMAKTKLLPTLAQMDRMNEKSVPETQHNLSFI